jgi:radical SAM protein with 4Fe4S-binding SPASM domain
MGKLDSLRRDVQDYLSGRDGTFDRIQAGLNNLIEAGFTQQEDTRRTRLGVSFVCCKLNIHEIERAWHYCRRQNIFPNIEVLTPTGRAKDELEGNWLRPQEIQDFKHRLLSIDRRHFGYDWLPHTPLPASGCLQHFYSLYVNIEGNVRPCAPTKFDENPALLENGVYPHNVLRRSLADIYDDPLFQYVRNIDAHLEGKCGACEHLHECIGCRGYAYSVGVSQGKDPYSALRGECLQCTK